MDGLARRTEAAADLLPRTSDGLRERTGELARHLRRLDGLCGMLDRIVERPAAAARQGRNLLWCLAAGLGTGLLIAFLGIELCPVRIGSRIAFSRAQQSGQAAQEHEPRGKAADEIRNLYT